MTLEEAHNKVISFAREFEERMSGSREIGNPGRAWNETAFKEMEALQTDEKEKQEAFNIATRKWIELRWPK